MDTIRATWRNGQIVPDGPVDWPEGYRLRIEPDALQAESEERREEDWSNSPEAIADWLAWYDSLEPLVFTPEEESDDAMEPQFVARRKGLELPANPTIR